MTKCFKTEVAIPCTLAPLFPGGEQLPPACYQAARGTVPAHLSQTSTGLEVN